MRSAARHFLSSWKWVLLYAALLFCSLVFVRAFMDWLEARNLQGLLSFSLLAALAGLLAWGFLRIRSLRGAPSGRAVLRFSLLFGLFVCCMAWLTRITVERVHFFEYGLLAALCFQAAGRSRTGPRRYAQAAIATVWIGFLDEAAQGLLPTRYYDNRDLVLNLVAATLALATIALVPLSAARAAPSDCRRGESDSPPGRRRRLPGGLLPADGAAVLALAVLALAIRWIGTPAFDRAPLFGTWQRENRCGTVEWMDIRSSGEVLWRDAEGGRARGLYRILGNRLDGPLLRIEVVDAGAGDATGDDCAWRQGETRDRYYRLDAERLVFRLEPLVPFRRGPES
ncbi:MAG: VanZ family protein [bacterium]